MIGPRIHFTGESGPRLRLFLERRFGIFIVGVFELDIRGSCFPFVARHYRTKRQGTKANAGGFNDVAPGDRIVIAHKNDLLKKQKIHALKNRTDIAEKIPQGIMGGHEFFVVFQKSENVQ
jgi:hypothetical protein